MAAKQRQRNAAAYKRDTKHHNNDKNHITKLSNDKPGDDNMGLMYPGGDMAFKILLSARFCSAIWSHVTDCDETYNYWEPSHFLLYGSGQQTWEYSPQYALRSYTYLLLHMVPAKLYSFVLDPNPVHVFYFVRCLLALSCALSEVYFYKNVCREFGIHVARLTLAFLVLSSGMFISSAAFLPSSFSMYFSTTAIAAWYARKYELAIFATAISSLIGWPFAALIGAPIAIEMLLQKRKWLMFLKWSVISAIVILLPMIWIDSIYYGKLVVAPLNLVLYNVFSSNGPNLYGTEPFTYYLINGFLNFNFIFISALLTPVMLIIGWAFIPAKPRLRSSLPYWYSLAPFYVWMLVFLVQPHKEERFLFPVYPLICLNGAITIDTVQKLYFFVKTNLWDKVKVSSHYLQYTTHITVTAIVVCGFFGLSRTLNLYQAYHAPMEVMIDANKIWSDNPIAKDVDVNFCVGKEWHRFPGSFFLPSNNWKLRYLKTEFKGQLPQEYLNDENATSIIQPNFNDVNKEEPSRYIDVVYCHYLLDLDNGRETALEPNYSRQSKKFSIMKSSKFLLAAESHPLFRAFYFPFGSSEFCTYGSYNILQNTSFKLTSKQKS